MDLPGAEDNLRAFQQRYPELEVIAISAKSGSGIKELKRAIEDWLQKDERKITELTDLLSSAQP
jgi:50S ribosomal subunit-associated GTPase HflX